MIRTERCAPYVWRFLPPLPVFVFVHCYSVSQKQAVFDLYLPGFLSGHQSYGPNFPLVRYLAAITAVCRYWREVAVQDSLLWSIVVFYRNVKPHDKWNTARAPSRRHLEMVQARTKVFLLRSQNVDLNLNLRTDYEGRMGAHVVLRSMAHHLVRCRTIRLVVPPPHTL